MAFALRHSPQMYLASNPQKRSGVVNLFRQGSPFQLQPLYTDTSGHYLILRDTWKGSDLTLCNIYAQNVNQISFLSKVYHQYLVIGETLTCPFHLAYIGIPWVVEGPPQLWTDNLPSFAN